MTTSVWCIVAMIAHELCFASGVRCHPLLGCTDANGTRCEHRQLNHQTGLCNFKIDPCPDAVKAQVQHCGINSHQLGHERTQAYHPCVTAPSRVATICRHLGITPLLMHIPKTGGKSFKQIFDGLLHEDWRMQYFYYHGRKDYDELLQDAPIVAQRHAGCPLMLFTTLRNPVERVISEFFHYGQALLGDLGDALASGNEATHGVATVMQQIKNDPHQLPGFTCHPKADSLFRNTSVMLHWMKAYAMHPATQNMMVKFLLGKPLFQSSNVSQADVNQLVWMMRCTSKQTNELHCNDVPHLFVGVLERWESTISRLAQVGAHWKHVNKWRVVNKTVEHSLRKITGHVPKEMIPEDVLQSISQGNQWDWQLYNAALTLDDQN